MIKNGEKGRDRSWVMRLRRDLSWVTTRGRRDQSWVTTAQMRSVLGGSAFGGDVILMGAIGLGCDLSGGAI